MEHFQLQLDRANYAQSGFKLLDLKMYTYTQKRMIKLEVIQFVFVLIRDLLNLVRVSFEMFACCIY